MVSGPDWPALSTVSPACHAGRGKKKLTPPPPVEADPYVADATPLPASGLSPAGMRLWWPLETHCPICNRVDGDTEPELPEDFVVEIRRALGDWD